MKGLINPVSQELLADIRQKGLQDGVTFVAKNLVRMGLLTRRQVADATGLAESEILQYERVLGKSCASESDGTPA